MKNLKTTVLFFLAGISIANAQKIKDDFIRFQYENMPVVVLPVEYTTYDIKVNFQAGDNGFKTLDLWSHFHLNGYDNKATNPDIIFEVNMGALTMFDKKLKKVVEKDPIVAGKTNTYFCYDLWFTCPIKFTAKTRAGKVILDTTLSDHETMTDLFPVPNFPNMMTQKKYTSVADLETGLTFQVLNGFPDIRSNFLHKSLKAIQNTIDENFGFEKIATAFTIYSAKSKKADYSNLDSASAFMDEALGLISKNAKQKTRKNWHEENIKSTIAKSIKIWESATAEYIPNKEDQKITKELLIGIKQNLMYGYFLMDDYTKANNLGQEIVDNSLFSKSENSAIKLFISKTLPIQENIYKKYKGIYF